MTEDNVCSYRLSVYEELNDLALEIDEAGDIGDNFSYKKPKEPYKPFVYEV
jgi:hypothetical protein